MTPADHYKVLGVPPTADLKQIRQAYLKLAVACHPDKNPDQAQAEEWFKCISQAYAVLSNPEARAKYDRQNRQGGPQDPAAGTGKAAGQDPPKADDKGQAQRPAGSAEAKPAQRDKPQPQRPGSPPEGEAETLDDFFQSPRGREILENLKGEFDKAGLRFDPKLMVDKLTAGLRPNRAAALGSRAAAKPSFWGRIKKLFAGGAQSGAGEYDISYRLALTAGALGQGAAIEVSYKRDQGQARRLAVKVPPGMKPGAKLRLKGEGHLKPDGSRGDLILNIYAP